MKPIQLKVVSFYSTMLVISIIRLSTLGPVLFKSDYLLASGKKWLKVIPLVVVLIPQLIFIVLAPQHGYATFAVALEDFPWSILITGLIGTLLVHGMLIVGLLVPPDSTLARIYQPFRFQDSKCPV